MLVFATGLLLVGGVLAVYGQRLFRVILPIAGLVVGAMVGFGGVQAIFGSGAISLTIAVLMAVIVAIIMGLLSFAFYGLAVTVLMAVIGATALTYLGIALGLEDNGFVLTLLGLSGAVLGLAYGSGSHISVTLVFTVTAMLGVALILGGVFLFAGEVTLDQLHDQGVIRSVLDTVDQSFLWFFVWIAGSVVAMNVQAKIAMRDFGLDAYAYVESKK